jgi:GT2 family glycosyltransferase
MSSVAQAVMRQYLARTPTPTQVVLNREFPGIPQIVIQCLFFKVKRCKALPHIDPHWRNTLTVVSQPGVEPSAPTVGAVVVNYNGGRRVLRVVQALLESGSALSDIIVVDNSSDDDSPTVRLVVLETNVGLSVARNIGLGMLRTPLALLLDHDVYVGVGSIERMVAAYREHQPAVVCPRIRLVPEQHIVQTDGASLHFLGTLSLRNAYLDVAVTPQASGFVDGAIGACLLLDRAKVISAGGFDELFFFYFEDLEIALRLRLRGERIWCEPAAEVFHERADGTPGLSFRGQVSYPKRRAHLTMRNRLITIFIHYRWRTLLVLLPALLLYELASFVQSARMGWLRQWWQAWSWQFRNLEILAARRRTARASRVLADRDVLTGGMPPLAPGLVNSRLERVLLSAFSVAVNGYWRMTRRWIG